MIPEEVKGAIEQKLDTKVTDFSSIGGGCINAAGKITTSSGVFFIKWNNAAAYPGMFEAEAKGLSILKKVNAVYVPKAIASGDSGEKTYIICEYIEKGSQRKDFWENFGAGLAQLHKNHHQKFGLDHDNYIGSLPQYNFQMDDWVEFFIQQRLEQQIELARNAGKISSSLVRKFEKLYPKLNEIFPPAKPSLLHGDLWSGNYLVGADGYACIVDPAVYYGYREIEIAFTQLFGGYSTEFYNAYNDHYPMEKGFDGRKDIYNLYPLMVHVNLFGGSYLASVENILRQF